MTRFSLAGTTAVVALLAGHAAQADVSPEDVWQNWQDMSSSYGQTMTAESATRDGDTLVVSGLTIAQNQDGAVMNITIDEVNFADNGDGTVDITMSDSYQIDMTLPAADPAAGDTPTAVTVSVAQPGMVTTVSGTAEEATYAVEAPSITVSLEQIDGVDAAAIAATAEVTMTTLAGTYTVAGPADDKTMNMDFDAQSVAVNVMAKDPDTQSDVRIAGTFADLEVSYALDIGGLAAMGANLAAALRDGSALSGSFRHGPVDMAINVTEGTGPTSIAYTGTGGGVTFEMDQSGMLYSVDSLGTSVKMSGPEIPFPELNLLFNELAMTIGMPLLASDTASDFTFLTRIVDLSVSEELWAMLDPSASLPHDPATVILDTRGKVRLTTDLVDEAAMAALGEAPPGEIQALDVAELRASAAGAELTGAGGFTFDNTDLVTFGGMPVPTGKIDLRLVGGNVLLDKLVAMGLLTDDDANGARMMMSMFANPGAGEDELTSTLEFKDKGFYANGQRLQ